MTDTDMARILPPETELSRSYWEGCRLGELRLQRCNSCSEYQFYPRIVCSHCDGRALSWEAVSGRGHIASFTVVRRGISKAYAAPYIVVLVDLEEGPRLMSNLVGCEPEAAAVGAAVEVKFEAWGADSVLPVFQLAGQIQLQEEQSR